MLGMNNRARYWRIAILATMVGVALLIYGKGDLGKAIVGALITAYLGWVVAIETELIKTRITWTTKNLDWKREVHTKADYFLFDLMALQREVINDLAFRPTGETEEQWAARASKLWAGTWENMKNVRRELWSIRATIKDYEQIDADIQELSGTMRGIIVLQQQIAARTPGISHRALMDKWEELKTRAQSLDKWFREETKQVFEGEDF